MKRQQRGSILVGLLWCLMLLSLVVIGVLHTSRMDLKVVKHYGDGIQAHYLAVAGIEKAKAVLYQNAHDRTRSGKNHTGELYNAPDQFREVRFGRGSFSVLRRGTADEGGGIVYGVSDEESRLNVNYMNQDQFTNFTDMPSDTASAILEWRGRDEDAAQQRGNSSDYYLSLRPPYQMRNAPYQTVRELLMVRGVSADLLFGQDTHQNGGLPVAEEEGDGPSSSYPESGDVDFGWAGRLTVDSGIDNINATGQDRVNVQSADETELQQVHGITPAIARAIVAYRGQNQFKSIADLLDVTTPQNQGGANGNALVNQNQSSGGSSSGGANGTSGGGTGAKVISEDLLIDIADDISITDSGQPLTGTINVNTAQLDVLMSLPGFDRDLAQAVISYRKSNGFLPNIAQLLKVPGMNQAILKQVAPFLSARSETYRILCEGKISSTGVRRRIQEIVHIGLHEFTTRSYREDDL